MQSSSSPSASLPNNDHDPAIDASNLPQQPQQPQQPQHTMPSIPLAELPLRPSTLSLLQQRGFVTTAELEDARVQQGVATLAAELDLTLPETANLLMEIQSCLRQDTATTSETIDTSVAVPPSHDAHTLLLQNQNHNHIVTYCQDLDQLLGGGIALGQVTEIAGLPGTGKTQLAMQLAVMCRLPRAFGGVEGKTLYIDAEGSFAPERCAQMASALKQHVQIRVQRTQPASNTVLTERDFLESIQVFRVHDEASQTATLQSLPQYLDSRDAIPVKLVVVDSIAFHYRAMTHTNNYGQRTKSLIRLAGFLADLARSHHLAVVCLNQMTTKIGTDKSVLVPALGESWAHAVTTRLLLQMPLEQQPNRQARTCQLVKSPHRPSGMVPFQITPQGIRRVPPTRTTTTTTTTQQSQEYQTPLQKSQQSEQTSSLRRPLQPHNLKPPPSYSKTTPRGNNNPLHHSNNPRAPIPTPPPHGPLNPRSIPHNDTPTNAIIMRPPPPPPMNNTPHYRTVTPHPLSNPHHSTNHHPPSTVDLKGLKRRRLL